MTFAAGLAVSGKRPFISVYPSFSLQRAYDQINHDVARMNLPVVIGIDRCGLVGEDGETHHGVFDIAMLRHIPNMILSQPKDAKEAQNRCILHFSRRNTHMQYVILEEMFLLKKQKNIHILNLEHGQAGHSMNIAV